MDRTQVFVCPEDHEDVKECIGEMERNPTAADVPADLMEYNKPEFCLKSDRIIMSPCMRGDDGRNNDTDSGNADVSGNSEKTARKNRISRRSGSCDRRNPVHRMNRHFRKFKE
ncbi:MAG: hypothetical protein ACOX7D_03585 [Alphaproteobacteria bacterium]|jgi:hypothetical protein